MRTCLIVLAVVLVLGTAPELLAPAAEPVVTIGSRVPNLTFKDIRYLSRSLDDFPRAKAFALVFVDAGCPLAERYLPTLEKIESDYRDKGVVLLAVDGGPADSIPAVAALAVRHDCSFPFVKDFDAVCARALGVTRTPECVVLDADRKLRYRGRIDDQYRLTGGRGAAATHELRDAIDAVLAGKEVTISTTPVDGCPITRESAPDNKQANFAKDVAPIVKARCQECHRPGAVGPFSLLSYEQLKAKADTVADVIADGRMPPWHAAPEFDFANRRSLTDDERNTLLSWLRSPDHPRGEDRDAPAPLPPAEGWRIGKPDLVISVPEHKLPASGDVPYQYSLLPTFFLHDTWVQGIEIQADNPRVMHHCNMAFFRPGEKFGAGNFITGQVPGGEAMTLSDGVAFKIPAGSVLGLQIHFVTTGKPERCKVSVGFRYPRTTVDKQIQHLLMVTTRYAIPPFAAAYPLRAARQLPCDAVGVGMFAHMHLRGKDITFQAKYPDGREETLLLVPNFSFNWQQPYRWPAGGKTLPKGTVVECTAHYDNSAFNPFNPDPSATVHDGPQTSDEMMDGFLFFVNATEKLGLSIDEKTGRAKQ
ncbi:MAG TPA: redoxin domain-containing protein [Gemmataceae bacterium]|nr:redoxin domain-containing protein [Gemmataceae bacterium]